VDPGPILIILQSPVYFPALFTLLAFYYCFPLDTLITFVSSKPVRLTTSSQVGSKVFVCVCAGSALPLAEDESASIVNGALVGVLLSQSASPSVVIVSPLLTILNLGFITEGKLAATLIIPSSWGSQRAGHSPRTRTNCSPVNHSHRVAARFSGAVAGEERRLLRGEFSHTHSLLCFIVLLYFILFYLRCFLSKIQKN
jgi:hypothetical protein